MVAPDGRVGAALVRRHPLQRIDSPSRTFSAALHVRRVPSLVNVGVTDSLIVGRIGVLRLVLQVVSTKPDNGIKLYTSGKAGLTFFSLVDNPNDINSSYGWHFQYLTIIGLFLATVTFFIGFLADIFNSRRLFRAKNALSVCSTPLEILISALYWTLASIDKRLVLPDFVEETTKQVDFGFHLVPAVVLALDLLFFSPPWTISALPAMGISACLSIGYWAWVEACYTKNGFYPYPIFNVEPLYRSGLFLGSAVTMTINTLLLKWAYEKINGVASPDARPGDKRY